MPDNFPDKIAIDGWSKGSSYFVNDSFASYLSSVPMDFILFTCILPMVGETCFSAADSFKLIEYVLSLYDKNFNNVFAFTGDNAEINKPFLEESADGATFMDYFPNANTKERLVKLISVAMVLQRETLELYDARI